jgi:rubrerythrin
MKMSRRLSACIGFLACNAIALPALPALPAGGGETVAVMQAALSGELTAHARYAAYAKRAREERFPRLGYFAVALSVSEGIHARNFRKVLEDLRATPDVTVAAIETNDTQANLRNASSIELAEIDTRYPAFLKRLANENNPRAIEVLTFAWNSEKQHRALISKIISGTGIFFGLLTKTFEETPVDYFVCQNCGSTLPGADLPKDRCPICSQPVVGYMKIDPNRVE